MDEVAEVKNRLEIAEVVGAYVPLKQAGRNLKAPCPFHQEKSASFMVSPERGIYHCFGCGEGGDIFSFVMKMEGVEFREALEILARKAGVELKERKSDGGAAKRQRERLQEAHELAVRYFQASLAANKAAIEYVSQRRGLTRETVREFGIGYAPDSWDALSGWLLKKGFTIKELLAAGLAGQKAGRNTVYDLFRARIMFPIGDREGRPIGFTGRVLDDSEPKYFNTPQTVLFDKSSAIFGWHVAREAIRARDEVVLVEGQMDVVASHQAGVKQVVATSGTALTLEHLRIMSKLTKNIKLAFDSDRAGLAATERAIELGQKLGLSLQMVTLPEGFKDADELVKKDPAAWERAIAGAQYIVDYLFDRFERDYDLSSAVGKRGYSDRLAPSIRRLADQIEQEHYIKLLAEKTDAGEEAVRAKVLEQARPVGGGGITRAGASNTVQEEPVRRAVMQAQGKPGARQVLEESLLALVLMEPLTRICLDDLGTAAFSDERRRAVFVAVKERRELPAAVLAETLTDLKDYVNILLLRGEQEFERIAPADRSFEAFGLARRLQIQANNDRKQVLNQKLREAEANSDAQLVRNLLAQYQQLLDEEEA